MVTILDSATLANMVAITKDINDSEKKQTLEIKRTCIENMYFTVFKWLNKVKPSHRLIYRIKRTVLPLIATIPRIAFSIFTVGISPKNKVLEII